MKGISRALVATLFWLGSLIAQAEPLYAMLDLGGAPRYQGYLRADKVLVDKSARQLSLLWRGRVVRSFAISLGEQPRGHKRQQGDQRTPEGLYRLDWRNGQSGFYKSIHISYPNARDRAIAERRGIDPGGDIVIHGIPNRDRGLDELYRGRDWTDGCIAVTDAEMDQIWLAVADGTPIEILP